MTIVHQFEKQDVISSHIEYTIQVKSLLTRAIFLKILYRARTQKESSQSTEDIQILFWSGKFWLENSLKFHLRIFLLSHHQCFLFGNFYVIFLQ